MSDRYEDSIQQGTATMPLGTFERQVESYLFMVDRVLQRQIVNDPKHAKSYPFFSHTNQVSNINKDQAELAELRMESSFAIKNMFMDESDLDAGDWMFNEGLLFKGMLDINKARGGWFFEEVKKRGRDVTLEEVQAKRRGILGGLFRRQR